MVSPSGSKSASRFAARFTAAIRPPGSYKRAGSGMVSIIMSSLLSGNRSLPASPPCNEADATMTQGRWEGLRINICPATLHRDGRVTVSPSVPGPMK